MRLETATLQDGRTVRYHSDVLGEGGMKTVYFTEDKSSVVCFFKSQNDATRLARLEAVLGKFNPTTDPTTGSYFRGLYCWPTAIVMKPRLGVMAPAYPKNFIFTKGPWSGKEKESTWFTGHFASGKPFRSHLPPDEVGPWIHYFKISIMLARAVRRLHQAGLAHSDLSNRNVLIDPSTGQSIVIDIDSLVVPQLFPPDVLGTPGYIAPEVMASLHVPFDDPNRKHPCVQTDLHALPTLLYQYLMVRHPLKGPKIHAAPSGEEQERIEMGSGALFVEHPSDRTNRPPDLKVTYDALGPLLRDLFDRVFIKGLHSPFDRPSAGEWEQALTKTWDMLHPCANPSCSHQWLVLQNSTKPTCPFCKTPLKAPVPVLHLRKESRPGQWLKEKELVIWHGCRIYKWHVFDNVQPNEYVTDADRNMLGYCVLHNGQWLLVNEGLTSLTSPGGNRVPAKQAVALTEGAMIRLAQEDHGRIAEVKFVNK